MKIARVLHQSLPRPIIALERDGALYDIGALDRCFETPFHPERLVGATDFFSRVVALRGAGLDELDERLRVGDRPTEARLLPGTFIRLPPCDTDRALYVQQLPEDSAHDPSPGYRIGNARAMLGHEACVPFPSNEARPAFDLGLAVILAEDLRFASADEAEQAILGYTILSDWKARDIEARLGAGPAHDFATQLGPTLVTRDEIEDLSRLRAQVRIDGQVVVDTRVDTGAFSVAETIAFMSQFIELRAGDVIGVRCAGRGGATQSAYGTVVELLIERLGKLSGRPMRGPAEGAWRRS